MLPDIFRTLRLPVFGAPLFLISNPDLVIAQCQAGIIGSFPALNARPIEQLEIWLKQITEALDRYNQANPDCPAAPYAVNQIVHKSNDRLMHDLDLCVRYKVPIMVTSLGARVEVNEAAHSYGGITLHDIIHNRFARKAVEKGADGLIAVAAGAGGHAGTQSPFALVQEIREWFEGPILLSGAIATGASILAAEAMGADLAYIGSPFIATHEARAPESYKTMITECGAEDVLYTKFFTGILGNYLRPSVEQAGFDPDHLPMEQSAAMNFDEETSKAKAWRDIWGSGQGIGAVREIVATNELVARLQRDYQLAKEAMARRLAIIPGDAAIRVAGAS